MDTVGYPVYVLYILLGIGIPLAMLRPYNAFLFIVFMVSAAENERFTYTRTPFLGPYFNMHDACLLIVLISLLPNLFFRGTKIEVPNVIKWIVAILMFGFFQSFVIHGWTYETLRMLRWSFSLPAYFIIAATVMDKQYKVKDFLLAMLLGSFVSAIEHILFVQAKTIQALAHDDLNLIRSIAFRSPGLWFLLSGIVWVPRLNYLKRPVMMFFGVMFGLSVLLNQTRSIWISSVVVLPVAMYLFKQRKMVGKAIVLPLIIFMLFGGTFLFLKYVMPEISASDIIMSRVNTLLDDSEREESTEGRQNALKMELKYWSEGTLIFGRGLFYFQKIYVTVRVAWGHLGHVTTLAQLGLIGLFLYSVYLPGTIVKAGLRLWNYASDEVRFLGLFAGVTMIWCWICFLMSDNFFSQLPTRGLIFGAAWRQAMLLKKRMVFFPPDVYKPSDTIQRQTSSLIKEGECGAV